MVSTPTPLSSTATLHNTLLVDTAAQDNCFSDSEHSTASTAPALVHTTVTSLEVNTNKSIGNNSCSSTTTTAKTGKMLPTTHTSGNNTMESDNLREDSSFASSANLASSGYDLNTDNLPAVDTPDACDKAAFRYVSI